MLRKIVKYISNIPAWRTDQKLILFLSDDWGGMRVPSVEARQRLLAAGINMTSNRFNRFDSLENNQDLENLFEVLLKHKNQNGIHPIITAVSNVASPDYKRIKAANYEAYFYKTTLELLAERPQSDKVHQYYLEGIQQKIYAPEFHGREHLEINYWLKALQAQNGKVRAAFEEHFFFLDKTDIGANASRAFGSAYQLDDLKELASHEAIIKDGLSIFEKIYGYSASCFTPPATYYHSQLNGALKEAGISIIDIPKLRQEPQGQDNYKRKFHYTGQKTKAQQRHIVRNAVFEPNLSENDDTVDSCLASIAAAFQSRQPAIISNHRAAFVGGIDEKNRTKGLKNLDKLLAQIFQRWPDAVFITSRELNALMNN